MKPNDETHNASRPNTVKNPNLQEANKLAIYKRGRGTELGSTEKQLQLSDDLRISSLAP